MRWIVHENQTILYVYVKIWPSPIITSWNLRKDILYLMKSLEKLNCPYYQEIKFLQEVS